MAPTSAGHRCVGDEAGQRISPPRRMAARVSRAHGAGHLIEPRVQQHPVLAGQASPDLDHAVGERGDHHLAFDGGSPPPLEHRVGFTGEDDPVDLGTEGGRVAGPSPIHRGCLDHGHALVTDVLGAFDDDPGHERGRYPPRRTPGQSRATALPVLSRCRPGCLPCAANSAGRQQFQPPRTPRPRSQAPAATSSRVHRA